MPSLFKKTKNLVMKIDNFLDLTSQSSMHFKEGVRLYIENRMIEFEDRLLVIRETEGKADTIRKDVEAQLYVQTLIPESRGDVLGILESMDTIIDKAKSTMLEFSIEKPLIPDILKKDFLELTEPVVESVESLVAAARAYFYDIYSVKDHLHKVKFYEKEADKHAEKTKRKIFDMDIDLSEKMHLRSYIYHIDILADKAEEVANRISIASIKRIV